MTKIQLGHLVDRCVMIVSRKPPNAPGVYLVSLLLKFILLLALSCSLDGHKQKLKSVLCRHIQKLSMSSEDERNKRRKETLQGMICMAETTSCFTTCLLTAGLQVVQEWVGICIYSNIGQNATFLLIKKIFALYEQQMPSQPSAVWFLLLILISEKRSLHQKTYF